MNHSSVTRRYIMYRYARMGRGNQRLDDLKQNLSIDK